MPKLAQKGGDAEGGDLDVGDEVTVTWARELYGPVQYHSFEVGPFTARTKVREGETAQQAISRAYAVLRAAARQSYPEKRDEFLQNVDDAATHARERRR